MNNIFCVCNLSLEFLGNFFTMYGTFIPLQKSDVLSHLEKMFNVDFTDR